MIRGFGGVLLLALAACAGERPVATAKPAAATLEPQFAMLAAPPPSEPMQCVPYARRVSGIDLRGDAWTWWGQAKGRYARGKKPRLGAVLVFQKTRALPRGHVSVVTRVVDAREIVITHSNWSSASDARGQVTRDVRVIDISPGNDWSEVRVWNGSDFGRPYAATGFIYPVPTASGA
ncbi:MAG TPA: CHAP domain-containing protein [Candidatus Acidoferrum sp.]|nr:CHAP domain-containing protein [Candidatus Acidoferrum sp.]